MASRVFINYRRNGAGYALLIYDKLRSRLPEIFYDADCLNPGERFGDRLYDEIRACDTLVAVITPGWGEEFARRLQSGEKDWVKTEIVTALEFRKRIIPVLAGGITERDVKDLPPELGPVQTEIAGFFESNGTPLNESTYEVFLAKLGRTLWRWPPPVYWLTSAAGLAAVLFFVFWLRTATLAAESATVSALLALLGWVLPNVVALAGWHRRHPVLPGTGALRRMAASWRGLMGAAGAALLAVIPFFLFRTVTLRCEAGCPGWDYEIRHGGIVEPRRLKADTPHKITRPAWDWHGMEIEFEDARGGLCFPHAPSAFDRNVIHVPRELAHNRIEVSADERLRELIGGIKPDLVLHVDGAAWSHEEKSYSGQGFIVELNPCSARPPAVKRTWKAKEVPYLEELSKEQRFTLKWTDKGVARITLTR